MVKFLARELKKDGTKPKNPNATKSSSPQLCSPQL